MDMKRANSTPARSFGVCATEVEALSVEFAPHAPLLFALRALLVVLVGGQPIFNDTREVSFFQLTPVCVVAEADGFARLHREYFGDSYYHPVSSAIAATDEWAPENQVSHEIEKRWQKNQY